MNKDNVPVSVGDFLLVIGLTGIAVGVGVGGGWHIAAGVVGTLLLVIGLIAKRAEAD